MSATEFELEGIRFEVKRLSLEDTCASLEILGKVLGPVALEVLSSKGEPGAEDSGAVVSLRPAMYASLITTFLSNASQIAVLTKLYAPYAKVNRQMNGTYVGALMVELKPFLNDVFAGRIDLMVAFLVVVARAEHGCFLGGTNVLEQLMGLLGASTSKSPTGPTG